jgi:hypothetical protein
MFLALTPAGGEDAASTAGQEAGVTFRDNATSSAQTGAIKSGATISGRAAFVSVRR